MIIEFRVRNYRSIREECALSLVASSDKSLWNTNVHATGLGQTPNLLRSAVIYGGNASGKTTLLQALLLMRGIVLESASLQPGQQYNVKPFLLDKEFASQATMFEVMFLISDVRYQYGFEFTANKIESEWLIVYEKTKAQLWFDRKLDSNRESYSYRFGGHLTGSKRVWQDATRPNALFLSMATQLNSEKLKPLHEWFANSLCVFPDGGQLIHNFTTNMLHSKAVETRVSKLMSAADIAISSISTEPVKGVSQSFNWDLGTGQTSTNMEETDFLMPKFKHSVGGISAVFDLHDESQGTQKLFALAGPLFDILDQGHTLVIDELDRSLHPHLVRKIIEAFQNPEINQHGAQLIFTTHDTSLLDTTLLRRDQIWFTEKRANQSTELVPLSQFSPRKGEAIEKGYLSGRYGGVPILAPILLEQVTSVTH